MIIAAGKGIKKSYGIDVILEDATFAVQEEDKVGIVGVNGAGKSTLFRIITGSLEQDQGDLFISKNVRLGYMSQDFDFDSDNSIWDELVSVFRPVMEMEHALRELEGDISRLGSSGDMEALNLCMKNYADLQERYKSSNGFGYQSQVKGVIKGLGFTLEEYDKKVSTLSGGQKTRIALGKVLLQSFDVLLLDEPTNYLDIPSVEWLEGFLKNLRCAVLIISHDRYFLDVVTNRTFEIENGVLTEFEGNYSKFIEKKQQLRALQMKSYQEQQKEIARQEAIIARYRQFNREKSIIQAESREKALEKMERIEKPDALPQSTHFKFEPRIKSGNDVLKIENLSKAFDRLLFRNASMEVSRGEKVALLGPNGIGKTTLLKMVTGAENPDTGSIRLGTNVFVGYYEQEQQHLNPDKTVIDEIWDDYPFLNQTELRNKLAAFLFQGEDVFKEVYKLSGGEKSRISLLKLMLSKSNFLLMDEPTNHLDILSKEVLEDALVNYDGTVLLVSHDRYFLNKVATKIIDLAQDGCTMYPGNYTYYINKKSTLPAAQDTQVKADAEEATLLKADWLKQKEERASQRKQQKRLEFLEQEIPLCEERIREIERLQETPEVFSDHIRCQELHDECERQKACLDALYQEWSEIS